MVEIYQSIEADKESPAESILKDIRVLFADDDPDTLEVLSKWAGMLGWVNCYYVKSASRMIEVVNEIEMLDAVVADINYFNATSGPSRLTGITAAREIRKVLPSIPIVFISAYVTSIIREEVRRVSAEILEKPFDFRQLFTRLAQLIYWHRNSMRKAYGGPERRHNSVNQTHWRRRVTDISISVPDRIQDTLTDLRSKYNERGK